MSKLKLISKMLINTLIFGHPMSSKQEKKSSNIPTQNSKISFDLATSMNSGSVSCTRSDTERPNAPIEQKTPAMKELKGSRLMRMP